MSDQNDDILDGLEERIQSHSKAFESLLALTPAQDYYGKQVIDGQDPNEQWNRKKQTKEQKVAARKAKLDPANQKSALDIMKERETRRKRELGIDFSEGEGDEAEPSRDEPSKKKQRTENDVDDEDARQKAKAERRKEKRRAKAEKAARKREKAEAKRAVKQARDIDELKSQGPDSTTHNLHNANNEELATATDSKDLDKLDFSGLVASEDDKDHRSETSSAPSTAAVDSPVFDISANHSTTSSLSSIIPPTTASKVVTSAPSSKLAKEVNLAIETAIPTKQQPLDQFRSSSRTHDETSDALSNASSPKPTLPKIDNVALQERLKARIEELRARRKADGPDGKPAKSRQELLDQRRKKDEQRKAHKKELRRKQKEEEARKKEEKLRGSASPLTTPDIFSPQPRENSFSFGRMQFEDGTAADSSMTTLQDLKRKKGPQDAKTALLAAENKQKRINSYDPSKRSDIAEKDLWLNARKRAHGERVRDDTSLLKKALKRKEKQKSKSEKEWHEREQAVIKGKEAKQKKREMNLQKRKDEKGAKKGGKKSVGKGKKKGRPGFEGRFKA